MRWILVAMAVGCSSGGDSPADSEPDTEDTDDTVDTVDTSDTEETDDTQHTDTEETAETPPDTDAIGCDAVPARLALGPTTSSTIVGASLCGLLPLDGTCLLTPDTSAEACGTEPRDVLFLHLQSNDTYRIDFDNVWMFVSVDPVQPPTCGGTICSLFITEGVTTTVQLQHVDTRTDRRIGFSFENDEIRLQQVD